MATWVAGPPYEKEVVKLETALFGELAARGFFPVWLAVVMAVMALIAVGLLYRREAGRVPPWRRAGLAALRGLALATILFLLLRPTLVTDVRGETPKPVVLLVDDSQSMQTRDPRLTIPDKWRAAVAYGLLPPDKPVPKMPSAGDVPADTPDRPMRIEVVKAFLGNKQLDLLRKLGDVGPVRPAAFGARRAEKDPRSPAWVESLEAKETRTALADAIGDLLKRDEVDLPAAIVVITDGRENASHASLDDVAKECGRLGVPVHVVGIGGSSFGTLQVRAADAPETLFVDDTVAVPVRYRVRGYKEGVVEITLKLNGNDVARKTVPLAEGEDLREVLSFVPQEKDARPGKQDFTATVRVMAGAETVTDELSKAVRVIDRKVKVLVIDSSPRWDFKFLQRALLRDRRVEAKFYLTDADPKAMRSGPPFISGFPDTRQELFAYDLLVIGDLPASSITREQQQYIRDFVTEGGGVVHIAGRTAGPASFVGTPLAEILPVEFQAERFPIDGPSPAPYRPEPTPAGLRSPLLSLADDPVENLKVWKELPEMYWFYPVTKLKPAAEVFLTHPRAKLPDGKPMPLLAAHYFGKGYVLYCGFDETWRWRFNEADAFFGRFWSQTVYLAGVPRTLGTKLTQLSLDAADPVLGKTGQVFARLFSADLHPLTADRFPARLEKLDADAGDADRARDIDLKSLPGQPGEYTAAVPFNRLGRFAFKVDTGTDPASLEYRVTLPPDHELAPGGMAEEELRKLAELSGGAFYREEDLHALPKAVRPQLAPFARRDEVLLWNKWMLFAVVGLLSLEWFLRKFSSLS
jgi:uncharacterized membrane protein